LSNQQVNVVALNHLIQLVFLWCTFIHICRTFPKTDKCFSN